MAKKLSNNLSTKVIHEGNKPDGNFGAIIPPIYQTTTYVQSSPGEHKGYDYTRCGNPTRSRLEECLASAEQGKFALTTASGLSAAMLVMHMLPNGSNVLCGDDVYGGTYRMLTNVFNDSHNINFIDTTNLVEVKEKITKFKPKLIWLETPTNPLLKISDIKKISKIAKQNKCLVVVDNTFMSPYFQNPLLLGADIVMHSLTKYINGHSDVIGGALILNNKKIYDKLFFLQKTLGPSPSPFDSWLVLRGIKTLAVRMKAHEQNAFKISKWLEDNKKVDTVFYPGLKSHPQHKLAKSQMSGFGGMITFKIKGGIKESRKFLKSLKLFYLAESLGGVESLIEHPAIMTHASVPKNIREELGITDNLIRISVGIEDSNDLINDLDHAFRKTYKS
ncbi:MAG: PLP-dependent transferase [Bdellovibrionales bacterium]|nr:PLP-dependent transferase [Bdellovibrionales bacterium]